VRLRHAGLALVLVLPGVADAAGAGRPYTPAMTCAAVQALIGARGAVSLTTAPYIYEQYIRDQSACLPGQTTQPDFIPTKDDPHCLVYRCRWRWSNHPRH
jgi:hypothetical protein